MLSTQVWNRFLLLLQNHRYEKRMQWMVSRCALNRAAYEDQADMLSAEDYHQFCWSRI